MKVTLSLIIDDNEINDAVLNLVTTAGTCELSAQEFIEMYLNAVQPGGASNIRLAKKATVKKKGKKK